jgi:hypothetical protein
MRQAAILLTLLFPTVLSAQPTTSREIFLRAGLVKLWDDEGNLGIGPSIGAGAGIKLPHNLGIEGLVDRTTTSRTLSGFVGIRFAARRRVFLRPEFELSQAGEHLRIGGSVAAGVGW